MSTFADVLKQLAGGQVYTDLSDKLTETVLAVQETRKVGEVTIRLKIKPNGEHGVMIADEVKVKVPERPRGETMFFVNAAGHLMRNDPRQEVLPLRQISSGAVGGEPLRTINTNEIAEVARAY